MNLSETVLTNLDSIEKAAELVPERDELDSFIHGVRETCKKAGLGLKQECKIWERILGGREKQAIDWGGVGQSAMKALPYAAAGGAGGLLYSAMRGKDQQGQSNYLRNAMIGAGLGGLGGMGLEGLKGKMYPPQAEAPQVAGPEQESFQFQPGALGAYAQAFADPQSATENLVQTRYGTPLDSSMFNNFGGELDRRINTPFEF